MGQTAARGVAYRAGLHTVNGQRVASGSILTIGSFDCVVNNAKSFAGATFPEGGSIVHFGNFRTYVAIFAKEYPTEVLCCLAPSVVDASYGCSNLSLGDDDDYPGSLVYAEAFMADHSAEGSAHINNRHQPPARTTQDAVAHPIFMEKRTSRQRTRLYFPPSA